MLWIVFIGLPLRMRAYQGLQIGMFMVELPNGRCRISYFRLRVLDTRHSNILCVATNIHQGYYQQAFAMAKGEPK